MIDIPLLCNRAIDVTKNMSVDQTVSVFVAEMHGCYFRNADEMVASDQWMKLQCVEALARTLREIINKKIKEGKKSD